MKTSKKDFELFRKCCKSYLKKFALIDWDIVYEHKDLKNNEAMTMIDAYNHNATIALNTKIETDFYREQSNKKYIDLLAKHEVVHILIGDFSALCHSRYVQKDELISLEEALVRKLINLIN